MAPSARCTRFLAVTVFLPRFCSSLGTQRVADRQWTFVLCTSLVLCALPPADCRAQERRPFALDPVKALSQYQLRAWTAEDGLPMNSVVTIVQTRDGYLWLGTEEGLVRFDGVRFTVYDPRNTPAMRNPEVVALDEGADGTLWVGTMGGGVLRVRDGTVTALTAQDGLASDFVTAVYEDRGGHLWVGTSGGGLSRVSGGAVQTYGEAEGLPNPFVQALLEDRQGNLWVGTRAGLARFKDGAFVTYMTRSSCRAHEDPPSRARSASCRPLIRGMTTSVRRRSMACVVLPNSSRASSPVPASRTV